jgi:hypothetical protein
MKKKMPKEPKTGKPKISIPKIAFPKIKAPKKKKAKAEAGGDKPRKRKLPVKLLLIVLVIALAAVGFGYLKGIVFKEKTPQKTEESAKEDQNKESDDIDMTGLENHLATEFLRTLKSDQYMIRYTTTTEYNGEFFEVETTYAVNGKSIAMTSGDRATIVKDDKVYMLDHTNKRIISWDVAKSNDLRRIDTDGLTYVGSSDAGGLVCEEYATASTQIKLYFEGEKLVRIATVINKIDVVMNVEEVGKKAPDSLFVVPEDYFTTAID